jgi:hypothetical protein
VLLFEFTSLLVKGNNFFTSYRKRRNNDFSSQDPVEISHRRTPERTREESSLSKNGEGYIAGKILLAAGEKEFIL